MFFSRKPRAPRPLTGKTEIFVRHCFFSKVSAHKQRPRGFSRQACFENFCATLERSSANVTYFLDGEGEEHFVLQQTQDPVIRSKEGSEAGAFLRLLDYILSLQLAPDTLLYILEDDYLHRPHWHGILREAFELPIDYATLYDHRDKYVAKDYAKLSARLFATKSCHWRTTPSTTMTVATRFATLKEDLSIHRRYSQNTLISKDHQKYLHLARCGRVLVSALPGFSCHAEPEFVSPCFDWEQYFACKEERI